MTPHAPPWAAAQASARAPAHACEPPPTAATWQGLPGEAHTPPFQAPWQAQAFAITLALHERGLFTWPEWAAALTAAIGQAQAHGDPDDGSTYYSHWLDALEQVVLAKGLADSASLHALEHAWETAAARTPHGQPIVLGEAERTQAGASAPPAAGAAAGQAS